MPLAACSWLDHPASGLTRLTRVKLLTPTKIKLASRVNLLAHYAKGTLLPKLQLLLMTSSFIWHGALQRRPFLSLAVLYAIDRRVLALGVGTPFLQPL